jgi:hypothetical protein
MAKPEILDIDPRTLYVPPSRPTGADPFKLQTQIARFGASSVGMPLIWVYRGTDNKLMIWNGVTRATRIAKLAPGATVRVVQALKQHLADLTARSAEVT